MVTLVGKDRCGNATEDDLTVFSNFLPDLFRKFERDLPSILTCHSRRSFLLLQQLNQKYYIKSFSILDESSTPTEVCVVCVFTR